MRPAVAVWKVCPPATAEELGGLSSLPRLAAQVLYNRGVREAAAVEEFLHPDYRRLGDPLLMKGMAEAATRIAQAIAQGEPITIFGDFDADGVTSATLLVQALETMGARVEAYIPHRIDEGYGLNEEAIERLAANGTRLLITVDCGISNAREVARATELGVDVIVTDHHHVPEMLPPALAILNPRQPGCDYPFKRLAGVGIAFTLVRGLAKAGVGRNNLRGRDLLDLVALGTVTDVAPLVGENRILVAHGLEAIRQSERPGLRALMTAAGVRPDRVGAGTIGFMLGPRLNAAGRLSHAKTALHLLQAKTLAEATPLASELDTLNKERQEMTESTLQRARQFVMALPEERKVILLADADFPAGVVGLVANKLLEEFYRPTLLLELGEEESRGSARSIPAFHITEALAECGDLLLRYGGHRVAAGFSLRNDKLAALEERLDSLAAAQLDEEALHPAVVADAEAGLEELTWDLVHVLERMAPFGLENPQPVLLCRGVKVRQVRPVGATGDHMKLVLSNGQVTKEAIAFRQGHRIAECRVGSTIDIVCTVGANSWNGMDQLEIQVKEFRGAQDKIKT